MKILITLLLSLLLYGSEKVFDTIIVGGGIAGLSAAYVLQDKNILLLEKEDHVGGRALSGSYKGITYAKGTEYLGEPEGALKELIEFSGITPLEIPNPMDAKYANGKFYIGEKALGRYFLENGSSFETFKRFLIEISKLGEEYEEVYEFNNSTKLLSLDDVSVREWMNSKGFGNPYQDYYNVAARGLFGASIDEISMLSFVPELTFEIYDEEGAAAISRAKTLDDLYDENDRSNSYTFKGGISALNSALYSKLKQFIRLNANVTQIDYDGKLYTVTYTEKRKTLTNKARTLIMATPAPVTLSVAASVLSKTQKSLLRQIPYSSYVTINLITNKNLFDKAFDLSVEDGMLFTDIYDATWVEHHLNKATDSAIHVLGVYLAPKSYKDRSTLSLSKPVLLRKLYRKLTPMLGNVKKHLIKADIQRFDYAYPVMTPGAYQRLSNLYAIKNNGLFLAGDYMVYPTFEAAAQSGYISAYDALKQLDD